MKFLNTFSYLSGLLAIVFLLSGCTKEDDEKLKREALILRLVNEIDADSLRNDVIWLQNMGTRFALADNHKSVALKIKNRFLGMGFHNVLLDSFLINKTYRNVVYEQWQYNVITTIEGTECPDSLCIVGGHYDSILGTGDPFVTSPGANDNASGVAALMEIARVMKKYKFLPESTIMFIAFGAEEIGLWGSRNFAATPDQFFQKIRFMLNNDMIAYEPTGDPSGWFVNIIDYDNSHDLRSDAEIICLKHTVLNYINNNTSADKSDSYPFFTNGYKALFFASYNLDPNYHTLNDLAGNCNFTYCREIVKISCALLADKN